MGVADASLLGRGGHDPVDGAAVEVLVLVGHEALLVPMWTRLRAVHSSSSGTSSAWSGIMRSLRSLPTGCAASGTRRAPRLRRPPARRARLPACRSGQHLDHQAIAGRRWALAAANSLAASSSERNLGSGSGRGGMSRGGSGCDGGLRPVPLDEALEEDPDHPQPLTLGVLGQGRTGAAGWAASHTL